MKGVFDLRKAYIAPVSEYLTFQVDSFIAATCDVKISSYSNMDAISCYADWGDGKWFASGNGACETQMESGYCYYFFDGGITFVSY